MLFWTDEDYIADILYVANSFSIKSTLILAVVILLYVVIHLLFCQLHHIWLPSINI